MDPGRFLSLTVAVYFAIVNPHQNLRQYFSFKFVCLKALSERITYLIFKAISARDSILMNYETIKNKEIQGGTVYGKSRC